MSYKMRRGCGGISGDCRERIGHVAFSLSFFFIFFFPVFNFGELVKANENMQANMTSNRWLEFTSAFFR